MKKDDLSYYCPKCKATNHKDKANYCYICGSKLEITSLMEFYLSLKIPKNKINIEKNQTKIFLGFPFFLRKTDGNSVEAITINEYPNATRVFVSLPTHSHFSSRRKKITITPEIIEKFLEEGFKWYHESDMDFLWEVTNI